MAPHPHDPSEPRPTELAGAFVVAVLLHLLLLIPLALWSDPSRAAEEQPADEILVALEPLPVAEPPPAPSPAPPPEPQPAVPDEQPEEEPAEPMPVDDSLLGWKTRGEEPGRALRPPGPETGHLGESSPEKAESREAEDLPEPLEETEEAESTKIPDEIADEPPDDTTGEADEPIPLERPAPAEVPPAEPDPLAPAEAEPLEEAGAELQDEVEPLPLGTEGPRTGPRQEAAPSPFPEAPELPSADEPRGDVSRSAPRRPPPEPLDPRDFEVGGAFGDIRFESPDYNWSEYSSKVYWQVYRNWLRELWSGTRRGAFARDQSLGRLASLDGQVIIRFEIDRKGNVSAVQIIHPSLVATLDQVSAAALERAILPPLPDDFPRDREGVYFSFRLIGFADETSLKLRLWASKQAGQF